jgi:uncharacterized protein (DUF1499 family)
MKTTLIILSCLIIVVCILLFVLSAISKQEKAPNLVEGSLPNCSDKPNCVCSENKDDLAHYVAPLSLSHSNAEVSATILKQIIIEMGGTIQTESADYLAATFSSTIFGFIDDLEVRIDSKQNLIHIRSASRVGHSDMGVNKKRVELLKQLYTQNT